MLTPVFEQQFLDVSHAYRPRRSPHTALQQLRALRQEGYLWTYKTDIEDCFGSVNQELLNKEIDSVCGDVRMRRLILRILKSGVLEYGIIQRKFLGLPQGSPLSPLLMNIYLHPFDQELVDADYKLIRFADDMVVLARDEAEAEAAGAFLERALKHRKLRPSPGKTEIRALSDGLSFLGFHIDEEGQQPHDKSLESLYSRLRNLHSSCARKPPAERLSILTQVIQGWRSYFQGFGSFSPTHPEERLAAAEVALRDGDLTSTQRFLQGLKGEELPAHTDRLKALFLQADLPTQALQLEATITSTPHQPIPDSAVPLPSLEEFSQALRNPTARHKKQEQEAPDSLPSTTTQALSLRDEIAILRHKVHLAPHEVTTYQQLADAYQRSGQLALARGVLQRALELETTTETENIAPLSNAPVPIPNNATDSCVPVPISNNATDSCVPVPISNDATDSSTKEKKVTTPDPRQTTWWRPPDSSIHPSWLYAEKKKLSLSPEARERYLMLFQGRRGLLARAMIQPDGRLHYQIVAKHLGESSLQEMLDDEATYALYPIQEDGASRIAGIDIDITKQVMEAHLDNPDAHQEKLEQARSWALLITDALHNMGIAPLLELSGFKGYHVWFFLSHPMPARRLRIFMRNLLRTLPSPPAGIHAELFPDRDHPTPHDPGHPIKLPLSCHPKTGKRAVFRHPATGASLPAEEALSRIEPTSPQLLEDWLLDQNIKDKLEDLDERYPLSTKLMGHCLILRRLFEKAQAVRHLQHRERVSLLYTFGHIGEEGQHFLHATISLCYDYDAAITQRYIEKRRGFAISCPKLREKHGDLLDGAPCQCFFRKIPSDGYPTPLLHVLPAKKVFNAEQLKPKKKHTSSKKKTTPSNTPKQKNNSTQEAHPTPPPASFTPPPASSASLTPPPASSASLTPPPASSASSTPPPASSASHTPSTSASNQAKTSPEVSKEKVTLPDNADTPVTTHTSDSVSPPAPTQKLPGHSQEDSPHPKATRKAASQKTELSTSDKVKDKATPQHRPSTKTEMTAPHPAARPSSGQRAQYREQLHKLMQQYIELKRHMRGLERSIQRTSDEMATLFDLLEADTAETELGLLRRIQDEDGNWIWKLEF